MSSQIHEQLKNCLIVLNAKVSGHNFHFEISYSVERCNRLDLFFLASPFKFRYLLTWLVGSQVVQAGSADLCCLSLKGCLGQLGDYDSHWMRVWWLLDILFCQFCRYHYPGVLPWNLRSLLFVACVYSRSRRKGKTEFRIYRIGGHCFRLMTPFLSFCPAQVLYKVSLLHNRPIQVC